MRALGLAPDPNSATGGSSYDDLATPGPVDFPDPTLWLPPSDAQVDPGLNRSDRNNYGFGRRGNSVGKPWSAAPTLTGTTLATPKNAKFIIPRALGTLAAPTGTAPAPITTVASPKQSGVLPSVCATLIREEQTDRVSGLWFNTFELALPADGEGTLQFGAMGLYHEVSPSSGPDPTTDYSGNRDSYEIRTAKFYDGATGTDLIDCVSSTTISFGNALIDDARTRFCAGKNIIDKLDGGRRYRLWYPDRNRLGPQTLSVTMDFGTVQPGRELERLFSIADKLVIEATAGPVGTTPASDDLIRFTFGEAIATGGGADPFRREGEQFSSYEYTGGIDEDGNDLEVAFAGVSAVAFS